MKVKVFFAAIALLAIGWCAAAQAQSIASCYDGKLRVKPPEVAREIFVAIDQTTLFDMRLKQSIADNIKPFLARGHAFAIMTFSAFSQGRYTEVVSAGRLDADIDGEVRKDISKPLLVRFDRCLKSQPQEAEQVVGAALRGAFAGASGNLAKSDVLGSLKSVATKVKESVAKEKIVLVASDMLENSSITSFYTERGASVRKIDPVREMKLVTDNHLLADFDGAKIYVVGTGLLPNDAAGTLKYRDPKTMQALASFWQTYFDKSNANLVELGQPALMNPIR
jgi:hypothetical protein